VIWHVNNSDKQEIHFQIGGHPAFLVPDMQEGEPLQGRLRINTKQPVEGLQSHIDGSVELTEVPIATNEGVIAFDDEFFANDSVKIHRSQTSQAELLNSEGKAVVTVSYKCPVIAFWSPYQKQAPFVCIEPWYGLGDPIGFEGEFRDKPLMNHLQPGGSFMSKYDITIN
jgi:galactose mutarotase-like enzyme